MKNYSKIVTVIATVFFLLFWWMGIKTGYLCHVAEKLRITPPPPVDYQNVMIDCNGADIPKMQKATERGWENCLRQMDLKFDVVFYGNSITRNGTWQNYFPDLKVCNLGLGGDDLVGLRRRIGMVASVKPEKVFIAGGINGIGGIAYEEFECRYDCLIKTMLDSLPKAKIFLQSMLPIDSTRFCDYADNGKIDSCNSIIKSLANSYDITYIDLFSEYKILSEQEDIFTDGIHIKIEYYSLWVDLIKDYVDGD